MVRSVFALTIPVAEILSQPAWESLRVEFALFEMNIQECQFGRRRASSIDAEHFLLANDLSHNIGRRDELDLSFSPTLGAV